MRKRRQLMLLLFALSATVSAQRRWANAAEYELFQQAIREIDPSRKIEVKLRFGPRLFNGRWIPGAAIVCVTYGVLIAIAGIVGDLCESLMKRDLGKKDAAALLPGFGGLIDLTDSIVYAGPLAYLLWLTLPLANWSAGFIRLGMAVPSPFHWL